MAPWLRPLEALVTRAPQSQDQLLSLLASKAGLKAVLATPDFPDADVGAWAAARFAKLSQLPESDPQRERLTWKTALQDLLVARKLCQTPFASDKRDALTLANRWMLSPFFKTRAPDVPTLIADGFVVPFLAAASSRDSEEISRGQLLQNVSATYLNAKRNADYASALRALVAVSEATAFDSGARESGDWARFQLAQALSKDKKWAPAVELLEQIQSSGLRDGSRKLAQQWRRQYLSP